VNLTITADRLAQLTHARETATLGQPSRPERGAWSLARAAATGPPGGHGSWILTLPDGRNLTDFEHATPYNKGGKTCACNAGTVSRACHQVKQSTGWNLTQPQPGRHQWITPTGRVYIQEPHRYPI
jgi:hypothetical protein